MSSRRQGEGSARLTAAAALLFLAGCAARPQPVSLLLITIDTLRADHLGAYGYSRPTSPRIDALAREGVLFRRAYTPVPRTTQAVASILTGLYPKRHRARGLFSVLTPAVDTLSEILSESGYATWAVVSNLFLRPGRGFEQGFRSYSNPRSRFEGDSSREITDEALEKLRSASAGPFFLWVHYLDPHWPYQPGAEFASRFAGGYRESDVMRELEAGRVPKGDIIFKNPLSPADRSHLVDLYDGEIAQVDFQVGRLLDGIPDSIRRRLLIVLTADHGESLCEHDYCFAHGETLYDGTLRVPLIFSLPGRLASAEVKDRSVSLLDVAPSVLKILGFPDRPDMDGIPLFGGASGPLVPAGGHDLLFAETDYQLIHAANPRFLVPGVRGRWSSARRGPDKLIRIPAPDGNRQELYDLGADPEEIRPRVPDSDSSGSLLSADLDGWVDFEEGIGPDQEESLTPEQRERLRSLGYLQ